jgi:recombination-promoting nuclease RpnB
VPQHEDKLMTIAKQIEQKDIEEGMQFGEKRWI